MSVQVELTWYELNFCAHVGVRRFTDAMREKGGKNRWRPYDNGDGWVHHIEGAAGEMAVAKFLGVYWSASIGTYRHGGDVGVWQVRTRLKPHYQLLVRPKDPDGVRFFLVRGVSPVFTIVGWMMGGEAKREEWLHEHGGPPAAYFVPDEHLHPLDVSRWKVEIDGMIDEIGDASLVERVHSYLREQPHMILAAHERVSCLLEESRIPRSAT